MKIIFVNPPLSLERRYGISSQSGGQTPPFGLAVLSGITRANGVETKILDAAALNISNEAIVENILEENYEIVGFTAVTISIDIAAKLAMELKRRKPSIVTIVGGAHVTALPIETMNRFPGFDIAVLGEGDVSLMEIIENLKNPSDLRKIGGLALRTKGEICLTKPRPPFMDLDALPKPAFDLLPDLAKFYSPPVHTVKKFPAALIVASRGCSGKCVFCDRSVFGNHLRAYSASYTFEMVSDLYFNYGIREIQFRDDNFTVFRKRLFELCDRMIQANLDLVWSCTGRVDMVDLPLLKKMKDSGCWQIWFGIESGSQKILDLIGKNTRLPQIRQAVRLCRESGIIPCGFFIIGHPGESIETARQTIRLATKLKLGEAHFSYLTPFPGSRIYAEAYKYGSFDNSWETLNGWNPVFIPHGMTRNQLQTLSTEAFTRFFFRFSMVLSYIRKIRSFKHLQIYFQGFKALIQWLFRQSFR